MKTRAQALEYIAGETDQQRGRVSQRGRILRLLLSADEIPLPAILELGVAQYCARLNELRRAGFHIKNRTARVNGNVHSWYSLISDSPPDFGPLFAREVRH